MSGDKSKLLQYASGQFTDGKVKATVHSAERLMLENGFIYLLVKSKGVIIDNLTIHKTVRREATATGLLDAGDILIQSPQELFQAFNEKGNILLIRYADMWIGINSLLGYNNEMRQYDYRGEALENYKRDFVVYDTSEIEDSLFNNSIPLWLLQARRLELDIFPAFLSPLNYTKPYLAIEIKNSKPLAFVRRKDINKLQQMKRDTVRLYAVNLPLVDQQEVLYKIQNIANEYTENIFGIHSMLAFNSDIKASGSFGIIPNTAWCEFDINYNFDIIRKVKAEDYIRQIIVGVNDIKNLTLFNLREVNNNGET